MTDELTAKVAELRQKHGAATGGEWRVGTDERVWADIDDEERGICCQSEFGQEQPNWIADAEFIAAAHNHLPEILDKLEARRTAQEANVDSVWKLVHQGHAEIERLTQEKEQADRDRNAVVTLLRVHVSDATWAGFPERLKDWVDAEIERLESTLGSRTVEMAREIRGLMQNEDKLKAALAEAEKQRDHWRYKVAGDLESYVAELGVTLDDRDLEIRSLIQERDAAIAAKEAAEAALVPFADYSSTLVGPNNVPDACPISTNPLAEGCPVNVGNLRVALRVVSEKLEKLRADWESGNYNCSWENFRDHWIVNRSSQQIASTAQDRDAIELDRQHALAAHIRHVEMTTIANELLARAEKAEAALREREADSRCYYSTLRAAIRAARGEKC